METIVLASASARRRELLESLGIPFICLPSEVDESLQDHLPPPDRVVSLAVDKARAAAERLGTEDPRLVLGADTLVCLPIGEGREIVMGKPADREEARFMISSLAGKDHLVHTGIALVDRRSGSTRTIRSDSHVRFGPMNDGEIEGYLDRGEWKDVAGAYRIQGAAAFFIERVSGSWSGIVGLPLRELYVILSQAEYRFRPVAAD